MRQFWTPLARVLGLYGEPEPAAADGGGGGAPPPPPVDSHLATHWPQLYEAFRRHALEEWVPACKRHAEVSAGHRMALTSLAITPLDPVIAQQISLWQQEGDTRDLIRWLVQGPWNTPEVSQWVDFSGLEALVVRAATGPAPAAAPTSRFDWRQQPQAPGGKPQPWILDAQTAWVERPAAAPPPDPEPPAAASWRLTVTDAKAARPVHLAPGLTLVGQEKTVRMPDGASQVLKDQASLSWEGEAAVYCAVQGALVSGLHLAVRVAADGIHCRDLESTNGTFLDDQPLEPGRWTPCPAGTRLYLGGPAGDLRSQAPGLEFSRAPAARPIPVDATPLRPVNEITHLLIEPRAGSEAISVSRLPFMIGRDPRCDWVIGPDHAMVSRQHLVIEQVDPATRRVRVRDLSSQGLTRCDDLPAQALRAGAWVPLGSSFVLGASAPYPGVTFSLEQTA